MKHHHAIVIGGSIAGSLAACVLSDYFERITILDRDELPDTPAFRKGVPQTYHVHILLKRGEQIIESLFPGFVKAMQDSGAVTLNIGKELNWSSFGMWRPHYESDLTVLYCSRPLLEHVIRQQIQKYPNITIIDQTQVVGLETDPERGTAIGVQIVSRQAGQSISSLSADLILDASGTTSKACEWLAQLGYPTPAATNDNVFLGYATRHYKANDDVPWKMMYVQAQPPYTTRRGYVALLEARRWQLSLTGISKDYPPTDEAGFMDYLLSLGSRELYDVIKDAEPLSPIIGYRRAGNHLYHYESLPRYLENFLVMGDAVYAFNPIFAQGMTVTAMCALELDSCLRDHFTAKLDLTGLASTFQKKVFEMIASPWQAITGKDLRLTNTTITPSMLMEFNKKRNYFGYVTLAANHNPVVLELFHRVYHMLESPDSFYRPDIAALVKAEVAARWQGAR